MKSVYIVNGSASYHALFTSQGWEVVTDINIADLVCFTGGEDVSPHIYEHRKHSTTYNNPSRDTQEALIFLGCLSADQPMVGICRGAQFLNVISGGEMYQDVKGHGQPHEITDLTTGDKVWVTSTHHQMMKPSKNGLLVAASYLHKEREWWDGAVSEFIKEESQEDNEVVYYPETNALCFQPHPEMYLTYEEFSGMRKYFFEQITKHLGIE